MSKSFRNAGALGGCVVAGFLAFYGIEGWGFFLLFAILAIA